MNTKFHSDPANTKHKKKLWESVGPLHAKYSKSKKLEKVLFSRKNLRISKKILKWCQDIYVINMHANFHPDPTITKH